MTCQGLVRAIDPYLDDELSVLEVLRVQGHLLFCDPCRTVLESEAQLHALLAADAVQDQPSPALRERILWRVSGMVSPSARPRGRLALPRGLLAGVLLGGLLVAGLLAALPGLRGPEEFPPFAAEVAAKHRLYTEAGAPTLDLTTADVSRVAGWLEGRLGFRVKAPQLLRPGERLVGARVSSVADVPAAYLLYEWGGHRLSLFILGPRPRMVGGGTRRILDGVELYTTTLHGATLVWWEDAEHLYAAASTAGMRDLEEFARLCVRTGRLPDGTDPRAGANAPAR